MGWFSSFFAPIVRIASTVVATVVAVIRPVVNLVLAVAAKIVTVVVLIVPFLRPLGNLVLSIISYTKGIVNAVLYAVTAVLSLVCFAFSWLIGDKAGMDHYAADFIASFVGAISSLTKLPGWLKLVISAIVTNFCPPAGIWLAYALAAGAVLAVAALKASARMATFPPGLRLQLLQCMYDEGTLPPNLANAFARYKASLLNDLAGRKPLELIHGLAAELYVSPFPLTLNPAGRPDLTDIVPLTEAQVLAMTDRQLNLVRNDPMTRANSPGVIASRTSWPVIEPKILPPVPPPGAVGMQSGFSFGMIGG